MIGAAALVCLAQAIYYEARGEPILGQYAVAEVVMNRVDDPAFPDTVCAVTADDRGPKDHDCQFSYMCDGKPEHMRDPVARRQALRIAYIVGSRVTNITGGALFFHARGTRPYWATKFTPAYVMGNHLFYTVD